MKNGKSAYKSGRNAAGSMTDTHNKFFDTRLSLSQGTDASARRRDASMSYATVTHLGFLPANPEPDCLQKQLSSSSPVAGSIGYDCESFAAFFNKKKNYELKKLKKHRIERHICRKFQEMSKERDQQFEDLGLATGDEDICRVVEHDCTNAKRTESSFNTLIRDMPVDKIGIDEYRRFLSTCRIQETAPATELPAVRSGFERRSQLRSLDVSPALTGPEGRARRSKYGATSRDFFAGNSMCDAGASKTVEAPSPGTGSQFTSYGGS